MQIILENMEKRVPYVLPIHSRWLKAPRQLNVNAMQIILEITGRRALSVLTTRSRWLAAPTSLIVYANQGI